MPGTRIYTIHSPVERKAGNIRSSVSIVINTGSKDYLRQPYIASRDSVYRLSIAKYSKWESSPVRILRKEFKKAFSAADFFKDVRTANIALQDYYRLKIYLKGFERLDRKDGTFGLLEFDITLLDPDGMELYAGSVSREGELEVRNFIKLARVLSGFLQSEIEKSRTQIIEVLGKTIGARVNPNNANIEFFFS
jgi:hypothetical protein